MSKEENIALFDQLFAGTGMEKAAGQVDWQSHSLGPIDGWSSSLTTAISIALNSKFPMFISWGQKRILFYNEAYAQILGKKHPKAFGAEFKDVWLEIWPDIEPLIQKVDQGESVYLENLPLTVNRFDQDESAFFTFSYSPIKGKNNCVSGLFCAVMETTKQILSEKAIKDERRRLYSVLMQAPIGICIIEGTDHRFKFANDLYRKYFLESRDFLERPVEEVMPEAKEQGFIDILNNVFNTGTPFIGKEIVYTVSTSKGENKKFYLNFIYEAMRDSDGNINGILAAASDVTDLVQSRKEVENSVANLEKERDLREKFVAALTHDLRTPLTAAKLSSQLLAKKLSDDPGTKKSADRIIENMDRADMMIRNLLDASFIKAGEKLQLKVEFCDFGKVLNEVIEEVLEIHGNRFVVLDEVSIEGYWDINAIKRILENLLSNAVKYGEADAPVSVAMKKSTEHLIFSVHNKGNPIPDVELENLFNLYKRGKSTNDGAQKGWGLGLTLVKGLTEAHGGKVSVVSDKESGTLFTVQLPLDARNHQR